MWFQDGGQGSILDSGNETILAISNLCVALMLPIKFQLNPTYDLGDAVRNISSWPPLTAILDIRRERF